MIIGGILGPTASGKTQLSIELASHFNAEIINADSRQIFKDFIVGTAQPTLEEQRGIKHHLLNFAEPDQEFSAGAFQKAVQKIVQENPDKNFLLSGGTGFYFKSLLEGMTPIPEIEASIREQLTHELEELGANELHHRLKEFDLESFERLNPGDTQRVLRAHEVYRGTGVSWSSFNRQPKIGAMEFPLFILDRPREELYHRINQRAELMLGGDWQNEVNTLLESGISNNSRAMQSLGYPEVIQHIQGLLPLELTIEKIAQSTRRYAKRQVTYCRHQFNEMNFVSTDKPSVNKAINFFAKS